MSTQEVQGASTLKPRCLPASAHSQWQCDGGSPCGRCKVDNAICYFGERKRSHDKVYPKGYTSLLPESRWVFHETTNPLGRYVEMLEQQQSQLVVGLQELYSRILKREDWPGDPLHDAGNGQPLTHDILERLGVLKHEQRGSGHRFEEDFNVLQQRLYETGASPMLRRRSTSSTSESGSRSRLNSTSSRSLPLQDTCQMNDAPLTPPPSASILTASPGNTFFGASFTGAEKQNIDAAPAPSLEGQAWPTTAFLDDGMDFLLRYRSPNPIDDAEGSSNYPAASAGSLAGAAGVCTGLGSDWNDDEEFKALFNRVVA